MTRWILGAIAAGLVLTLTLGDTAATPPPKKKDEKKKELTLKEIMKDGHSKKGLIAAIPEAVENTAWEKATTDAKKLKVYGEGIGLLEPNKGDKESWKKLTEAYKKDTEMVAKGVEKKDAEMVDKGIASIKASCVTCHKAHK